MSHHHTVPHQTQSWDTVPAQVSPAKIDGGCQQSFGACGVSKDGWVSPRLRHGPASAANNPVDSTGSWTRISSLDLWVGCTAPQWVKAHCH